MVTDVAFLLKHFEMRPAFLAATLHCWLMFKLASARTDCPRAFSEDLLPQQSPTACVSVWDCSNPDASPCTAPCWTDECSCHPNFSKPSRSFPKTACSPVLSILPATWCLPKIHGVHSTPSPRLWAGMVSSTGPPWSFRAASLTACCALHPWSLAA